MVVLRSTRKSEPKIHPRLFSFSGGKASAGKLVHMKVVDDKLRIIDDVPSSAVEMAVKEKVRRQKTSKQGDQMSLGKILQKWSPVYFLP
jgi:hypothetical protein